MAVTSRTSFYSVSNPGVQIARALVVAGSLVASAVLLGYALDVPSGFGESAVPDGLRHPHWALLGIYAGAVATVVVVRELVGRRRYLTFLSMLAFVVIASGVAAGAASVIDRPANPFHLTACASPTTCESLAARDGGHLLIPIPGSALLSFQHGTVFAGPAGRISVSETFRSLGVEGPAQVQVGIASRQTLDASEFCSIPRWHQATAATGTTYCYVVNPCDALAMFSVGPATYSIDVNDSSACPATFRTVVPNRIRTIIGSFQ